MHRDYQPEDERRRWWRRHRVDAAQDTWHDDRDVFIKPPRTTSSPWRHSRRMTYWRHASRTRMRISMRRFRPVCHLLYERPSQERLCRDTRTLSLEATRTCDWLTPKLRRFSFTHKNAHITARNAMLSGFTPMQRIRSTSSKFVFLPVCTNFESICVASSFTRDFYFRFVCILSFA